MRLALLLVACCLIGPSATAAQSRNVLVLFSNNRLLPANLEVDRGFRETIAKSTDRGIDVFAEFLDRPAFSGQEYERTVVTYLREKYATRPPETIVVAGYPALDFLLRHRDRLFPAVPVVYLAVDKSFLQSISSLPADVVGVPVVYDFAGTIEQALRWHPNTQRLVLVTGASEGDLAWETQLRAALVQLRDRPRVEYLAGLTTDAALRRMRELGNTDVVFTPGYFRDGAGREFAPRESAALMASASNAPVYGPFSTFIGTGIVGGYMPTFIEMGRQAATTVDTLLKGAAPATLNLPASTPARVQVDWRQVQKWNIDADAIPNDAIVHFKEPTFWEEYKEEAIAVLIVFLLQGALIAALLVERRARWRTESALRASENQMNLASRAARLCTLSWDVSRGKLGASFKSRRDAGLSTRAPIHLNKVLETVHTADREGVEHAVRRAVEKGEELDVEYRTQFEPGGEVRWVAVRGRGEHDRLMGIALDITDRKVAELQAETDRAALTHLSRVSMMGQLSAAIAHQLNQPLAAILGNAEVARKMLDHDSLDLAELREICNDIVTEDKRASEVIRRLGALYKRGEMTLAPMDLNELVRETLELVRTEMATRHVVLVTDLSPALPPIDGGRVQLQQVLLNLILNAADAMRDTEMTERKLTVKTETDGSNARLCVVDRGTGIAPDNIKSVFDAFWSTKAGGIGVGLAICQSIITAHRGTLTAENNTDGGAKFCATWPVRKQT